MNLKIDTSYGSEHGLLLCPVCGDIYLHQGIPESYGPTTGEERKQHPSNDGGIKIEFSCEGCLGVYILRISQHKGNTFIGMYPSPNQVMFKEEAFASEREARWAAHLVEWGRIPSPEEITDRVSKMEISQHDGIAELV